MSKLLIYSFKTFPYEEELDVPIDFKFHRLKKDIIKLEKLIDETNPEIIIGIAKSRRRTSYFETMAVNVFSKSMKVDSKGIFEYPVSYPQKGYKNIQVRKAYTHAFCNWTMYRVSQLIDGTSIKLQFIHIAKNDLPDLEDYLKALRATSLQ